MLLRPIDKSDRAFVTIVLITSAALVALVYGESLWFGFRWDDYHMVRPWTRDEVVSVFVGPWDPTGIEPVFYRPLASAWYALRFAVFGVNAWAVHALSLIGMIAAAALTALFVTRETNSRIAGWTASALYAVHPAFVYSQAIWPTNQMHLLASLTVLGSLLIWQRARHRGTLAWWPLGLLQIVAFGLKEDTIVLLPTIVVLTMLRAWLVRDVRFPRVATLFCTAAIVGALVALRFAFLQKLGGYALPSTEAGLWFFRRGLDGVFRLAAGRLSPGDREWQPYARMWLVTILSVGGIAAIVSKNRECRYLFLVGVITAGMFNLPYALTTSGYRMHLVGLGAVLVLSAALWGLWTAINARAWRALVLAAALAGFVLLAHVSRSVANDFRPCSQDSVDTNLLASDWPVVPAEIRGWLRATPNDCRTMSVTTLSSLRTISWVAHDNTAADGNGSRWTTGRGVILVEWPATAIVLLLRHPDAHSGAPITVVIDTPAGQVTQVINSAEGTHVTLRLTPTLGDWLGGMHTLVIRVAPGASDDDARRRDLQRRGVEFKVIEIQS